MNSRSASSQDDVESQSNRKEKRPRRFKTEEEYAKNMKRKGRVVASLPSISRYVPEVTTKKSSAFEGVDIAVLDGFYRLTDLDRKEARKEGWLDLAMSIATATDGCSALKVFLAEHGAGLAIEPTPKTLVLGGRKDDSHVEAYIGGIETNIKSLINRSLHRKLKDLSKTDMKVKEMASRPGVLRYETSTGFLDLFYNCST